VECDILPRGRHYASLNTASFQDGIEHVTDNRWACSTDMENAYSSNDKSKGKHITGNWDEDKKSI
jgi:hypothetical protein